MTTEQLTRVVALAVALAGVETLHGIARAAILVPRIGKRASLRLAIVTGSALAFGVCYALVPGMALGDPSSLVGLGTFLALFMASFEIALARLLLRRPWSKIWPDFDPRTGNYLLLGLLLLVTFPYLVMSMQ